MNLEGWNKPLFTIKIKSIILFCESLISTFALELRHPGFCINEDKEFLLTSA